MTRPRYLATLAGLLALLSAGPAPARADASPAASGERVLDMLSYWRSFYVMRPALTSREQWRTIPLPTAGRTAQRWVEWDKGGRKWEELRPEYKVLSFPFCGHMATSELVRVLATPGPAAGWETPNFDDSAWLRMRYPLLMNAPAKDQMSTWNAYHHGIAQAFFRGRFVAPDPARAAGLTLRVVYNGGIRVLVNGRELARGHLPQGDINANTAAQPYANEAYTLPPGCGHTASRCVVELLGDWKPEYADPSKYGYDPCGRSYYRTHLTREEWDGLRRQRDRVLGPLTIPAEFLRKGVNVVAVQVVRAEFNPIIYMSGNTDSALLGSNTHYGWMAFEQGASWSHCAVVDLELRAGPAGAVQAEGRPEGVQLWAEDASRRVFSPEFGDPGRPARLLRMVGARNGSCSAQLVVGTSRELRQLRAEVGDLAGPGGARIPAGAMRVRYAAARGIRDLSLLGTERGNTGKDNPLDNESVWLALWRYGRRDEAGRLPYSRRLPHGHPDAAANKAALEAAMKQVAFFDELSGEAPPDVPADSCQPVWLTVKIPEKTRPGLYAGAMRVTAAGMDAEEVPVRVFVADWNLPDPARAGEDFTTMVLTEQSPWGVAKAHKLQPWTEEHWRQVESSLKLAGELGNDGLMIPVLLGSEFGNRDDSMVIWVRGRDGRLTCDFARFDRYMDLAVRHGPRPAVVCFVVAHPTDNYLWVVPQVLLRDETTGKTEPFAVPMGQPSPFRGPKPEFTEQDRAAARELWRPFVAGVLSRMEQRGLKSSVFWGYLWDGTECMDRYREIFEELAPGVKWARGCHGHGGVTGKQGLQGPFGCVGTIVCLPQPYKDGRVHSHKGWKTELLSFSLPRVQNAVLCVEGGSVPPLWRIFPELALCAGARGICRIGLDYWDWTWADGWRGGGQVGLGVKVSVWPGPEGARGSARFEMLREGLQEAEARAFLERKLETSPDEAVQRLLDDRIQATLHIPRSFYFPRVSEQLCGWQERSWDLYAAAAAAAGGKAPGPGEKARFFAQPTDGN